MSFEYPKSTPLDDDDEFVSRSVNVPESGSGTYSLGDIARQDTINDPLGSNWANIGVWGLPSAGKTAQLAACLVAIGTRLGGKGYIVEPARNQKDENWEVARKFMELTIPPFLRGEFPGATLASLEKSPPFTLWVGYKDDGHYGREGRFHSLTFLDASGEFVTKRDIKHFYWQHLLQTHGIMIFIDGEADYSSTERHFPSRGLRDLKTEGGSKASYYDIIQNFSDIIKTAPRLPYLSVCITKVDTIREYVSPIAMKQLVPETTPKVFSSGLSPRQKLLKEIIGEDAFQIFHDSFKEYYKIFLSSATGWYQDKNTVWHSNFNPNPKPGTFVVPKWRPFNTIEPLLWLFDKIEQRQLQLHRKLLARPIIRAMRRSNLDILYRPFDKEEFLP
ncbi:MAG: hypothetical protein HY862_13870 [Chloroflexi bacterium]|nr:hypothetical protein [Chloroflexota bacterium]